MPPPREPEEAHSADPLITADPVERQLAGKGMKQDRTEPKDVGGRTDFLVFPQPLLGDISRVAPVRCCPAAAISPHDRFKVHQLGHAPATEYDVRRPQFLRMKRRQCM